MLSNGIKISLSDKQETEETTKFENFLNTKLEGIRTKPNGNVSIEFYRKRYVEFENLNVGSTSNNRFGLLPVNLLELHACQFFVINNSTNTLKPYYFI